MDIQILEIDSPWSFRAREIAGPGMSAGMREYQQMDQEIQNYCESSQYVDIHVLAPQKGQMYLAKKREENESHWYRCIVKTVLRTSGGAKASCYLIDVSQTILVSHTLMREIPDKFRSVPCQVQDFALAGIQPITMSVSFLDGASMKPTVKWDTSACEYFGKLIKGKALQCQVVDTDEDGIKHTLLFVKHQGDLLNVNNILVKKQFACRVEDAEGSPGSSNSSHTPSPTAGDEPIPQEPFADVVPESSSNIHRAPTRMTSPSLSSHPRKPLSPPPPREPFMSPRLRTPSPSTLRTPSPSSLRTHSPSPSLGGDGAVSPPATPISPRSPTSPGGLRHGGVSSPPVIQASTKAVSPRNLMQNMQIRLQSPPAETSSGHAGHSEARTFSSRNKGDTRLPPHSEGIAESSRRGENAQDIPEPVTLRSWVVGTTRGLDGDTSSPATKGARSETCSSPCRPSNSGDTGPSALPKPKLSPMEKLQQMQQLLSQGPGFKPSRGQGDAPSGTTRVVGAPDSRPGERHDISAHSDGGVSDSSLGRVQQSPGGVPSGSEEGYSSQDDGGRQTLAQATSDAQTQRTPFLLSSTKIQASLSKQLLSRHESSLSAPAVPSPLTRRILVHGERPPKLILDINTSPFPDKLKQYLRDFGYPGLTLIQSACWAAISRGRDVVGVATRDQNISLAYLAPLVAQMMQSSYTELPAGHGPITLIVSSVWQRALNIYQQCLCLNGNNTNDRLRALLLHRGGSEQEQKVKLMRGAPIIVATLPCVLRLVNSRHLNLNRLFHLVVDEADSLFEHHLESVKDLMVRFRTVLRLNQKRSALRQLMVFSSKWTVAMGSYLRTYLTDPLVIITDPLEMAVYGRAPQKLILIHPAKRITILLEKLNSGLSEAGKVMVFTSTKETARDLVKILKCSSCFTLLAAGEMLAHQLEEIRYEWQTGHRSDSQPVLVVSDDCVEDLELQDASCIIHYDLPTSKTKYGKRMSCLKEHYAAQIEKSTVSSCQVMTFVTPGNYHHLYSLLYIVKRSGQQIPGEITLDQALEYRDDRRSSRPLCRSIKSFGFCRQISSCAGRHFINPSEDQPGVKSQYMNLPQHGQVKILVMHVVDAVTFYARIMKYQPSIQEGTIPVTQLKASPQLNVQLSRWFSNPEKCAPVTQPVIGKLYAAQDNKKSIHRVLVEKWIKDPESEERKLQVKFVDEGRTEVVHSYKLMTLPKTFRNIPYQAVEVIACGVMPPDKESTWTTQANLTIHNLVHGEELEGKVVLSLGNTMWLDPVVQRIRVPDLNNLINRCNVRVDIMEGDFGVANPSHVSKIRELCSGRLQLEQDANLTKKHQETVMMEPHYDGLTVGESHQVYLSAIGSPHQFSVQKVGIVDQLDELMVKINQEVAVEMRVEDPPDWSVGDLCVAKFPSDERWYRGKITEVRDDLEVVFIDHGDQETVPHSDLKPLPNQLLQLPFAAIDCTMPHITPKEGGDIWTSEPGDDIWAWCNEGADKKTVSLQVLSEEENDDISGGDKRYSVEMFLFLEGKRVAVSSMLAEAGRVNIDRQMLSEILMPVNQLTERDDASSLVRAVCQQCKRIFNSEEADDIFQLTQELYQQITEIRDLPESSGAASTVQEGIVAVCRLLNHHSDLPDKSRVLLTDGLLLLVNTDWSNAKVVVEEGCIPSLCMTLKQIVDPSIRRRIFWLFNMFPTKKLLTVDNFIGVLFEIFITVPSPDIQICCLQLLIKLWQREDIKAQLPLQELITAICNILWGDPDETLVCESLRLLHLLASDEESTAMMQKEKLGNCLECLSLSKSIPVDSEAYRLIMGMANIFDADSDLNSIASEEEGCKVIGVIPFVNRRDGDDSDEGTSVDGPLIPAKSLEGAASSERETTTNSPDDGCFLTGATPPPPLLDDDDQPIYHPQVRWSQRSNCIMISVQLRGVQSFILEVTSLSIRFSTLYDGKQYEFDLDLCNRVDPDNYTSNAFGHEVLITLYKEGVGVNWPRLTSTNIKLAYLSVDHERWKEEEDYGYDSEATTTQQSPSRRLVTDEQLAAATIPELVESTESSASESGDDVSSSSWSESESGELGVGKGLGKGHFATESDSNEIPTD